MYLTNRFCHRNTWCWIWWRAQGNLFSFRQLHGTNKPQFFHWSIQCLEMSLDPGHNYVHLSCLEQSFKKWNFSDDVVGNELVSEYVKLGGLFGLYFKINYKNINFSIWGEIEIFFRFIFSPLKSIPTMYDSEQKNGLLIKVFCFSSDFD